MSRVTRLLLTCTCILFIVWKGSAYALSKYEERLNELAEGVISEAAKFHATRLAVLDFTDQKGAPTAVGQFLAEELGTQLLVVGDLTVVDRQVLKATMVKYRLDHFDVSQAKAVRRVAKALRADLFVVGSFIEIPEGVQVTAKLIRPKTMQAAGAARAIVPKAGPLLALFKQPPSPSITAPPAKEPDRAAMLQPAHTNDIYAMTVTDIADHDQHITLEMTLENRSTHDIKIHCQLQDTYVKDDTGTEWKQIASENRDGLCMRGTELAPGRKTRTMLAFPRHNRKPASSLTLHFHEMSPRRDVVFTIEGLNFQPAGLTKPADTREATPTVP